MEPDPRFEIASQAAERTKQSGSNVILGIGGGSSLDIAKAASILVTNTEPISSLFGIDLVRTAGLPTILVPTTAGTGSEVTPIVILSDHHEKLKKGIVSPHLFPAAAILDPELTFGLPASVTAATGMDALIHAVEAFTSKNATPFTDLLALHAMSLIFQKHSHSFLRWVQSSGAANMLEGSMLAGMAFANVGATAVHVAYPIGAEFHIPHGVANSIMLVAVMEFNMLGNLPKFTRMAEVFGEETYGSSERRAAQLAVDALRTLAEDLKVASRLSEFGVKAEDIPSLAQGVMKVTRLLANNPRELNSRTLRRSTGECCRKGIEFLQRRTFMQRNVIHVWLVQYGPQGECGSEVV